MNGNDFYNFLKYTIVGTLGLIVDMACLYVFVEFVHIPLLIATTMAFVISVVHNFFLHKYWTFKDLSHQFNRQFISFFVIAVVNLGLTVVLMYIFVDFFHIWYMFSKVITTIIVLFTSYTANTIWTFKLRKRTV
ncbi:GtrA family protein [Candidatus Peregrinibacteria bacterium]|nr:GtrA family protein [Candidatus Peregrinibacteria bacterium]